MAAVQMLLDSVDVLTSRSRGLIVVAMAWLMGAGGMAYGATDEFGFKAVENKVHVHDLHATMLYLLGIDHTKLTYHYSGRDFRLTDTAGEVIHNIIA